MSRVINKTIPASVNLGTLIHSGAGKLSSPHGGEWGGDESIFRCTNCNEEAPYYEPDSCEECGGMDFEEASG